MRSARAAEWILSKVVPPDRAASIVGDWMEDAPERGNIWFWSCVFRTAIAGLWRNIANPLTTSRMCILEFARSVIVPIAITVVLRAIALSFRWPIEDSVHVFIVSWYLSTAPWILRRSNSRALVGCFAVCLFGWSAAFAALPRLHSATTHDVVLNVVPGYIVNGLIILPSLWKRRHSPNRGIAQ